MPRCGSSLRQFGCNTKVWQVSKRDFHQRSIEGAVGSGCGGKYASLTMGVVGESTPPAWRGRFPAFGGGFWRCHGWVTVEVRLGVTAREYVTPRCHCYASGPAAAPSSRSFVSAFMLLLTYSGSLLGDMSGFLLLRDIPAFPWTCYAPLTRTLLLAMCPPSNESSDATSPRSSERSRRKPTGLTKFGHTWARMND